MFKVVIIAGTLCAVALGLTALLRRRPQVPRVAHEPGRVAIDRALDTLYPGVGDHRMALTPAKGESEPPLAEVVAYKLSTPRVHWLYVTYGLSELGAKISDDREHSGFGIELTLRLDDASETAPVWPINYLRWLAKIVWRDRNPYDDGHSLPIPNGLLDQVSPNTDGAAFIVDPALGVVKTSNGSVKFLQVLPLTADELALISRWDAYKLFAELRRQDPDLLWRVGRKSILGGERRDEISRQATEDGSSQSVDFTSELSWDDHGIRLDALNRHIVLKFLRYRVGYGRPARVHSEDKVLRLEPGPFALHLEDKSALLSLPAERAKALADALEHAGAGTTVPLDGRALFVIGDLAPLGRPFSAAGR